QCLGALEMEPRAKRRAARAGLDTDPAFEREQLAAVRERTLGVPLGDPAGDRLALEPDPTLGGQRPGTRKLEQALDGLQGGHVAARLQVQIRQQLEIGYRPARTSGRVDRKPFFQLRDTISVVASHAETPVTSSTSRARRLEAVVHAPKGPDHDLETPHPD